MIVKVEDFTFIVKGNQERLILTFPFVYMQMNFVLNDLFSLFSKLVHMAVVFVMV